MRIKAMLGDIRRDALSKVVGHPLLPWQVRNRILTAWGMPSRGAIICAGVTITCPVGTLGDRVMVGRDTYIDPAGGLEIGDNVAIGPGCRIVTSTHEFGPRERRAGTTVYKPIRIGAGTWIGAGVTVLPGVEIGVGCIIAAGSVVTRNCDDDGIYAGAPAKLVGDANDRHRDAQAAHLVQ